MKLSFYLFILFIAFPRLVSGQNIIPNGNFEIYYPCPLTVAQLNSTLTGWTSVNSADYYNACSTGPDVGVPVNNAGYQSAASGNGYVGILDYSPLNYREYVTRTIPPLIVNAQYEVSMSVSLGDNCAYGSNGLGVYFYMPTYSSTFLYKTPQVSFSGYGPITDKTNWVRVSGTFIADTAFNNIIIGGFKDNNTITYASAGTGTFASAYYYIDSVVVKLINHFMYSVDTMLCAGDTIQLPYSFLPLNYFNSNNVFTVQLSNASGSFASPVDIGTFTSSANGTIQCVIPSSTAIGTGYRIRIRSSSPVDYSYESKSISIGNTVAKPVAGSNGPVCQGSILNLYASTTTSYPALKWSWKGPNSFTSNLQNPAIANMMPTNTGNYIVTASIYGCRSSDTETISMNTLPAKPVINSNTPVCSDGTLNLSASTTTTGVLYSWTGPNSFTSATQNPSISNISSAAAGDYVVTATIIATGCIAKDTEAVVVRLTPTAYATNNTPVCEDDTVKLFSTATPAGSFSWSGPNSFSSAGQDAVIINASPAASGDYIVSVTFNGCTGKDTTTVFVKPEPIMPLTGSNTPVCAGATLNLTANSNAGATYSWTGPSGFISTQQNPVKTGIISNDAGTYAVTATLNGCISPTGTTTVVVNAPPFVSIYPLPSDTICKGTPATFIALPANASTSPSYKWTRNSSPTVLSTASTFTSSNINNNDIIRCEMTDPAKCGATYVDTSNEVKMTVLPWLAPSVSITANPITPLSPYELIIFTAIPINAGNKPKYQWQRNGSDEIGAISYTWGTQQLNDKDSISVILTSDYKCPQPKTATSNKIKVTVLTGIDNLETVGNFTLYPNPNNGSFIIKGQVNSNKVMILQILNATGQLVYEARTLPKNKELYEQVDVQHLPGGLYMLRMNSKDNIRFTIER